VEPELLAKTYREIERFLGELTPAGPTGSIQSIKSIEDAVIEHARCSPR
jgi:hypothetical protein